MGKCSGFAEKQRRSRYLTHVVTGCLALATILAAFIIIFNGDLVGLVEPGLLLVLGMQTIKARLG